MFLNAHDMAMRDEAMRVVSAIQHQILVMEGLPGVYAGKESGPLPLPRGLTDSYIAVGHGDTGRTTLARRSTHANQALHPKQLGRVLARRKSLQTLAPDVPVWLLVCELSMTRPDQDLLTSPSSAQYVANEVNRTVFTVDRQLAPSEAIGGLPPHLIVYDDPDNLAGHIGSFRPSPRPPPSTRSPTSADCPTVARNAPTSRCAGCGPCGSPMVCTSTRTPPGRRTSTG
ncbi:hypothetical protein SHKM778_18860 [Streptomyces sp. KM77-8]|uniref:Uncharacterized protein n=1 Tax=Streptomyces haneummycinicus TaxID=3074435 RepID=A0AAT9HDM7_9ACTN